MKELGENVIKTRQALKDETLFELKRDSGVKSVVSKMLVKKSLGEETKLRFLSQDSTTECRYLDEITARIDQHQEPRNALVDQCDIKDVPMSIRLKNGYGGTQTSAIRSAILIANKLTRKGRFEVGWSESFLA